MSITSDALNREMKFLLKTRYSDQYGVTHWALAIFAGTLITASLSPFSLWPLGIVAIGLLVRLVSDATPNSAFWCGWCFGLGMFGTGIAWIYRGIVAFGDTPWLIAALLSVGFVAFISLFLAISMWLFRRFIPARPIATLLVFPAVWVLVEWSRYWPLSGLPWLYAGGGHLSSPLAGWLPVLGAMGTSYWVAFTAAAGFVAWKQRKINWLVIMLSPWVAGAGLGEVDWVTPQSDELAVALVQANTPLDVKWQEGAYEEIVATLQSITYGIEGADLIVWSETAVPKPYPEARVWLDEVGRRTRQQGSTLITGIRDQRFSDGSWHTYNSVVLFGDTPSFYDKRHLVPFGEFVPLEYWIRGWIPYFDLPNSHSSAGASEQKPATIVRWRVAALVCYEIAFANTVFKDLQTADLLVVVSNSNWFGKSLEVWQQYEMVRLRAAENGRPVIQASNDGITLIVDHRGEVVAEADPYVSTVLTGTATRVSGRTPFSYWGNDLSVILSGILVLVFYGRYVLLSR